MYAIIQTGGKQYKVEKDDVIFVEKINAEDDSTIDLDVIAIGSEKGLLFGKDKLAKAKVTAKVLKTGKGNKITVFTYKPKKSVKRKMGHRQPYTKLQIEAIQA